MRFSAVLTALLVACAAAKPHGKRDVCPAKPPKSSQSSTATTTSSRPAPTGPFSDDASCGGPNNFVCRSGTCCSSANFCGVTAAHCEAGCQPGLGDCGSQFVKISTGPPGSVSTDGTCGGTNGWICPKGNCCSRFGFCGATADHCAPGCQPAFGICPNPTPGGNASPDGTCGGSNKFICASGTCCSKAGFCGNTKDHCDAGCQFDFGSCGDAFVPVPGGNPPPRGSVSTDGTCAGANGLICPQGNCCSRFGFCGATADHCGTGCQSAFGICNTGGATSSSTSSKPAPTGGISPDGSCGGTNGFTCTPGNCCSQFGFCGATTGHCGTGCQSAFGICGTGGPASSSTSSSKPAPTGGVSPDGSCGGTNGYTCTTGNCCSQYGFCGATTGHCGTGCQRAFGICT
ncbi:hypothetical protein ACHAQF_008412 [Verticillium nonalfalfae]|uniref:Chitin binding protein n=1 Tax=Verticillium nonalfalfae TaxID=1051616 RepID=A0A3G4R1K2_9PEZI|nr:chitin binding protein precursor [Verticillium nonalfalfae]